MNQLSGKFASLSGGDALGLPEDIFDEQDEVLPLDSLWVFSENANEDQGFTPLTGKFSHGNLLNELTTGALDLEVRDSLDSWDPAMDKNILQVCPENQLVWSARLRYIWNPFKDFIDVISCLIFLWRLGLVQLPFGQLPFSLSNLTFATWRVRRCTVDLPQISMFDHLMYRRMILATLAILLVACMPRTISWFDWESRELPGDMRRALVRRQS